MRRFGDIHHRTLMIIFNTSFFSSLVFIFSCILSFAIVSSGVVDGFTLKPQQQLYHLQQHKQKQFTSSYSNNYFSQQQLSLVKSSTSKTLISSILYGTKENLENYEEMLTCSDNAKECYKDKTILITGASGGLGRELAIQLATCNVKRLILSGRNTDALTEVSKECEKICSTLQTNIVTADLADRESVQTLGQKALELCGVDDSIDVLINNGGVSSRSSFIDTSLDVDEKVMQINFFSGVALCKALIPKMIQKFHKTKKESSGKIIWISSVQGKLGIPNRTSYAASKFAVQGYCEGLRAEVATDGITVHIVSPGYIRTNLSKSAITGDGSNYGKMDETTAKGADPKDVAITILDNVSKGNEDFIVAATPSAIFAIWLRFFCPTILQNILVKRFQKSQQEQEDGQTKSKSE